MAEVVVMNRLNRAAGFALIVAGIDGLAHGSFRYTKAHHEARVGSYDLSMRQRKTVNVPFWAGITAIAVGALLLVAPQRK